MEVSERIVTLITAPVCLNPRDVADMVASNVVGFGCVSPYTRYPVTSDSEELSQPSATAPSIEAALASVAELVRE